MDFEDILYAVEGGVATITLNRPDALNAWRAQMERDVRAAMRAAADDDAVRVIVLTGAGRGFAEARQSFRRNGGRQVGQFRRHAADVDDALAVDDSERRFAVTLEAQPPHPVVPPAFPPFL